MYLNEDLETLIKEYVVSVCPATHILHTPHLYVRDNVKAYGCYRRMIILQ